MQKKRKKKKKRTNKMSQSFLLQHFLVNKYFPCYGIFFFSCFIIQFFSATNKAYFLLQKKNQKKLVTKFVSVFFFCHYNIYILLSSLLLSWPKIFDVFFFVVSLYKVGKIKKKTLK